MSSGINERCVVTARLYRHIVEIEASRSEITILKYSQRGEGSLRYSTRGKFMEGYEITNSVVFMHVCSFITGPEYMQSLIDLGLTRGPSFTLESAIERNLRRAPMSFSRSSLESSPTISNMNTTTTISAHATSLSESLPKLVKDREKALEGSEKHWQERLLPSSADGTGSTK